MQLTIGSLTDHRTNTKKHNADSHSLLLHSHHFLTPRYRWDGQKHTADNGSPTDPFKRAKEVSGTHCKRGVHQSCRNNQLLHHSTSEPGRSGRWSSETHSGNRWMQLHRGWRKARDYWEDKRECVFNLCSLLLVLPLSCIISSITSFCLT